MKNWMYDESKQCGIDYSDSKQAEDYDEVHQNFRDYKKEFEQVIAFMGRPKTEDLTLIDLGCGTGASTIYAAEQFQRVYAVDVSEAMISKARNKARSKSSNNIEFHLGGFLSYEHQAEAVDVILTKHAFHHLPDFWKQIALFRMNNMLKVGGTLYICDVVYHLESKNWVGMMDSWVNGFEELAGEALRREVETHIRDEYSTFAWVLEGMFAKAGFEIEQSRTSDGFVTEYLCRKVKEIEFEQTAE